MKDLDLIIETLEHIELTGEWSTFKLSEAIAAARKMKKVSLKVVYDEICYKSTADDQSYGMWCPVDPDHGFPDGTVFVRVDN